MRIVDVANRRDFDLRKLLERVNQAGSHAADADKAQHDLLAGRTAGFSLGFGACFGSWRARAGSVDPGRRPVQCLRGGREGPGGEQLATSPVVHVKSPVGQIRVAIARGGNKPSSLQLIST